MSRKTVTLYKWNPETGKFDFPYVIPLTRPEHYGRQGGAVRALCVGPTRLVVDGEPGAITVRPINKQGGGCFEN